MTEDILKLAKNTLGENHAADLATNDDVGLWWSLPGT
jgi:hypothetical protein